MVGAKADEMGPSFNVEYGDGVVRMPTVGSSGVPPEVEAVCTKYSCSQSAKSL